MENLFNKTPLMRLINRAKLLNDQKVFIEVISNKIVQRYIIKLNTDQMRVYFMDSNETPLAEIGGGYSDFTLQTGKKKGRDQVDLYDTGEFHDSFRIEKISGDGFDITSDPFKPNGVNLLEDWGRDIEGLTFENLGIAARFMLDFYVERTKKYLLS
jgi:hypothetical protein